MAKSDIYTTRYCKEKTCNKLFNITYGEKEFYESKGLNLPTHCEQHRGKIRAGIPTNPIRPNIPIRRANPTPKTRPSLAKSSGCIVSTLFMLSIPIMLVVLPIVIFSIFK